MSNWDVLGRRVLLTELIELDISTVRMSFPVGDNNFETIIFDKDFNEQDCWRYASEAEAIKGHEYAVALAMRLQSDIMAARS